MNGTGRAQVKRWGPPGLIGTALVLFFLPWIEIRCQSNLGANSVTAPSLPGMEQASVKVGGKSEFVISRSGLQIALNQSSVTENGRPIEQQGAKQDTQGGSFLDQALAFGYFVGLVAALVAVGIRPDLRRPVGLGAVAFALAMLVLLELMSISKIQANQNQQPMMGQLQLPIPLGGNDNAQMSMTVGRTPWYFLSYVAVIGALGIGAWDWLDMRRGAAFGKKPSNARDALA